MWEWILVIVIPILVLIVIEEGKEFFVNRYVLGPAPWEGKVKRYAQKGVYWVRKKLKKSTSTN